MSTILIADRLPIIRKALRVILERAGHQIVGEADNGPDALMQCRERQPDLLVTELSIPRLGGLDVIRRLRASGSPVKILVYSSQEIDLYASRCFQFGADAFVSKLEPIEDLQGAVNAVLHGRSYFPSEATHAAEPVLTSANGDIDTRQFSSRELTVLQLLAQGFSNQQIADQLALSYKTVSTYKIRLQQKLNVSSTFQLLEVARASGLVGGGINPPTSSMDLAMAAEMEKEHGMLRALIDSVPAAMMVRDREGRLLMCNNLFLERVGARNFRDICGLRLEDAFWYSPETRKKLERRYRDAVENEESFYHEGVLEQDGEQQPGYYWYTPYRDVQGRLVGMVGGMRDLTKRDAMLVELRHSMALANSASRMKSEALSAASVELFPLVELLGSLASVANGAEDMKVVRETMSNLFQVIRDIRTVLDRLDRLVDLDAEQAAPVVEAHHLGELTVNALDSQSKRLAEKGGELVIDQRGLVLAEGWIDVVHFPQLLDGLLRRAGKGQASPRIRLALHTGILPGGFLNFSLELRSAWSGLTAAPDEQGGSRLEIVHLHNLLDLMGAKIRLLENVAPDEMGWVVDMKLPLAKNGA